MNTLLNAAFALWKRLLGPVLQAGSPGGSVGGCPFQPTCSEYATLALAEHGLASGALMALWRILRCNPFSRGGWDPVPPGKHGPVRLP